jgi:hypothetical protein
MEKATLRGLFRIEREAQDAPAVDQAARRCWEATQRRTSEWASCPFFVSAIRVSGLFFLKRAAMDGRCLILAIRTIAQVN